MALEGFQTYFSELNSMRDCAQNPTNPLTKKAYEENPAEKDRLLKQVDDAKSEVTQVTSVRVLNVAAKVATKFTGATAPLKVAADGLAKYNDENLKEITEDVVDDTKNSIVPCHDLKTFDGTLKLSASRILEQCNSDGTECTTMATNVAVEGKFIMKESALNTFSVSGEAKYTKEESVQGSGGSSSQLQTTGKIRIDGSARQKFDVATKEWGTTLEGLTISGNSATLSKKGSVTQRDPLNPNTLKTESIDTTAQEGMHCTFNPNIDIVTGGRFIAKTGGAGGVVKEALGDVSFDCSITISLAKNTPPPDNPPDGDKPPPQEQQPGGPPPPKDTEGQNQ
jgi:hypothetical protein